MRPSLHLGGQYLHSKICMPADAKNRKENDEMTITKRIQRFITEVAEAAMAEPERYEILAKTECIAEYTDQIASDDYRCVVNYASDKGIAIPMALRGAIAQEAS